jgi:hypothetical protein
VGERAVAGGDHPPVVSGGSGGIRTHDSRIKSPVSVRPTLGRARRICGEVQSALCEHESSGLARVTSDEGILP